MPRATARFQFEWKVFSWAGHLSEVLTGEDRCFLAILDSRGAVCQLLFGADQSQYDSQTWEPLQRSNPCWLFYHPFDAPEYIYMQWQNVQRSTMERLRGESFVDADLVSKPLSSQAAGERIEFPTSWGVMF